LDTPSYVRKQIRRLILLWWWKSHF